MEFEQPAFSMGDAAAQSAYFADCRSKGGNLTTNVPMLHIDGRYLTQSAAVLTYCARKFGLYPTSLTLAYEVDNLLAAAEDLRSCNYKRARNHSLEPQAPLLGLPRAKRHTCAPSRSDGDVRRRREGEGGLYRGGPSAPRQPRAAAWGARLLCGQLHGMCMCIAYQAPCMCAVQRTAQLTTCAARCTIHDARCTMHDARCNANAQVADLTLYDALDVTSRQLPGVPACPKVFKAYTQPKPIPIPIPSRNSGRNPSRLARQVPDLARLPRAGRGAAQHRKVHCLRCASHALRIPSALRV